MAGDRNITIFATQIQNTKMKQKTFKTELTADELELIEAIRNYKLAFPNGREELYYYALMLFDRLTEHN